MAGTSIRVMADAVGALAAAKQRHLVELEDLTYRAGVEPGPDLAFAGLRILVAQANQAAAFLGMLAPHETALRAWLDERRAAAAAVPRI